MSTTPPPPSPPSPPSPPPSSLSSSSSPPPPTPESSMKIDLSQTWIVTDNPRIPSPHSDSNPNEMEKRRQEGEEKIDDEDDKGKKSETGTCGIKHQINKEEVDVNKEEEEFDTNQDWLIRTINKIMDVIPNSSSNTLDVSNFKKWLIKVCENDVRREIARESDEETGKSEIKRNKKKEWTLKTVFNAAINNSMFLIQERRYEGDIILDKTVRMGELLQEIEKIKV